MSKRVIIILVCGVLAIVAAFLIHNFEIKEKNKVTPEPEPEADQEPEPEPIKKSSESVLASKVNLPSDEK